MMYITANTQVKENYDSDAKKTKIIIFIEPGMSLIEFEDCVGITTSNEKLRVEGTIDELISSVKSLEISKWFMR